MQRKKQRQATFAILAVIIVLMILRIIYYYHPFLLRVPAVKKQLLTNNLKENNRFKIEFIGNTLSECGYLYLSTGHDIDLTVNNTEWFLLKVTDKHGATKTFSINSDRLVKSETKNQFEYHIKEFNHLFKRNEVFILQVEITRRDLLKGALWMTYSKVAGSYASCKIEILPTTVEEHQVPSDKHK